ncbi:choice-of-anchor M domain-containing protein [Corynebacterium auris]|uniref:choice-of-anchor M domain-containing protein n=1 Tax=Corynebacterium auris TaxID=44750 RepID=UPI0025B40117|nr:choice-of-anchor M domain-containing protein [Corynebacterium auris]WJY67897.1 hypothetical protein CAURIS_04910 [Corynebacterium auris]
MAPSRLAPSSLLLLLLIVVGIAPPAAAQDLALDSGHVDAFNVTADGGGLMLDLKEDVTGSHVRHAPEDVTLVVKDAAWSEATAAVEGIGQPTYYLPQAQDQNLIWPGWDTQAVSAAGFSSIDLVFQEVSGPGEVFVFETAGLGGINPVLGNGSLALISGSVITQPHPAHRHVNWAFTEPGVYTMRVNASGNGVSSNTATYTWVVGDGGTAADGAPAPTPLAASAPAANNNDPAPGQGGEAAPAADQKCTPGIVPMVKDDRSVPAEWRAPSELAFGLGDAAKKNLPEPVGPVPAGEAWMIGAVQEPGVPWLGANTQHPTMLENQVGDVTWELVSFEGPGTMVVFTQGGLGQIMGEEWFRGGDGQGQGAHTVAPNTHVHPMWLFSSPGTYKVGIRQSTVKDGATYSGTGVLTFHVGEGGGNANDGHFDLGGQFDPAGGDCASGAVASGASDNASASAAQGSPAASNRPQAQGTLAETGTTLMTLPFAILGVGLLVFGIGVARFSYAMGRAHK